MTAIDLGQRTYAPPSIPTVYGELTADGANVVLIAAGPNEDVAFAAKRISSMTPLIKPTDPPGGLTLPVSWPAIVQLSTTFGAGWQAGPRLTEWTAQHVARRTGDVTRPLLYRTPPGLSPREYQVEGANLIANVGRALISDEPGTGKTLTTILGLVERAIRGHLPWPCLVIAPASVVDSWVNEWRKWAPHLSVVTYRGTPTRRAYMAHNRPCAHVYVASYDIARQDAKVANPRSSQAPLLGLGARSLVIDEHHMVKTRKAMRTLAVGRLADQVTAAGGNVIGLSGTPITHHPGNLWPMLKALDRQAWPSGERWDHRYLETARGEYSDQVLGLDPGREPEFRMTLLGQHRRIAKADVLTQLPPKVYSVRTVELPPKYRKSYDQMEADMLTELPDGQELSVMGVLAQLTRLSQLACAAADVSTETVTREHKTDWETSSELVRKALASAGIYGPWSAGDTYQMEETHVQLKAPSWKIDALLEVLEEREVGEPGGAQVVVFAPSKQLIDLATTAAAASGRRVGQIVGGQSPKQRTAAIEAFQRGELDVILATTQAGGVGITLTAARTVVFLQRPWSLVDALQAEDRCHRIGSEVHDSIEVIDIVAKNTIDSRVRSVLREKAGQLADLVQDPRIVTQLLGGTSRT